VARLRKQPHVCGADLHLRLAELVQSGGKDAESVPEAELESHGRLAARAVANSGYVKGVRLLPLRGDRQKRAGATAANDPASLHEREVLRVLQNIPSYAERAAQFPPLANVKNGIESAAAKKAMMGCTEAVEKVLAEKGVCGAYIAAEVETMQLTGYWIRNFSWIFMQVRLPYPQ
jgi:hypothetical protein